MIRLVSSASVLTTKPSHWKSREHWKRTLKVKLHKNAVAVNHKRQHQHRHHISDKLWKIFFGFIVQNKRCSNKKTKAPTPPVVADHKLHLIDPTIINGKDQWHGRRQLKHVFYSSLFCVFDLWAWESDWCVCSVLWAISSNDSEWWWILVSRLKHIQPELDWYCPNYVPVKVWYVTECGQSWRSRFVSVNNNGLQSGKNHKPNEASWRRIKVIKIHGVHSERWVNERKQ